MGGGASHPTPHAGHGPGEPLVVQQPQPSLLITAAPPNPLVQPNSSTFWTHVGHTQTITDTSGVLHIGHDNNKEVLCFARGRMPDGSIRIGARAVTSSGYQGGRASIAFNGIEVHLNDCDVLLVSPNLVMSPMIIGGPPPPNAVICGQMSNGVPLFAGTAILQAGSNADQLVVPGTVVPQGIILSFMGKQVNIGTGLIHVLCVQPTPNPYNWKPPSTNMQYWEQFMNISKSIAMQQQQPMFMQQQQPTMMMSGGGGGSAWPPNQMMMQQQPQQPQQQQQQQQMMMMMMMQQQQPQQQMMMQQQQQQMRMQQQKNMYGTSGVPHAGGHTAGTNGQSSVPAFATGAAAGVVAGAGAAAAWGSGAVDTVGNWAPGAAGDAAAWGSSAAGDAAAWGSGAAQTIASSDAVAWGSSAAGDAAAWGSGAANNASAWGSSAAGDAAAWGSGAADSVGNWGGGAADAVTGWGGGAAESVGSWAQNIDAGSAFDGVGNAFNDAAGDVGGAFEDMGSALDDLF